MDTAGTKDLRARKPERGSLIREWLGSLETASCSDCRYSDWRGASLGGWPPPGLLP